jgi:transcriptional regulator with XRE-family HTH domain
MAAMPGRRNTGSAGAPPKGADPVDVIGGAVSGRVRQLRAERGWSLEALSQASGVSRSMLSQIERNQANPTLAVTLRIARALGISLGDLVTSPGASSLVEVIRANDRAYQYRSDENCCIRTLSPLHLEKDVEFYEVRIQAGGALRSSAHFKGTREFLTVQKGRVRVQSGSDSEELEPGDSASYRADIEHALVNIGRGDAVVFLVDIYQ